MARARIETETVTITKPDNTPVTWLSGMGSDGRPVHLNVNSITKITHGNDKHTVYHTDGSYVTLDDGEWEKIQP